MRKKIPLEIKKEDIEEVIKWKVYFDTETCKPCGQGYFVTVAAPDEKLPPYINKPQWVEEREAVMIIMKKKR